jgi:predicted ATPase
VQAWSVLGASAAESRFDALRMSTLGALVGRSTELATLSERWASARAGHGQVALVAGEAGIGKSRLVRELREHLPGGAHITLSHYCSPYHTNSMLRPILDHLERAAGFTPIDDSAAKLTKLEALLAQGCDDLSECVPLIGALLSIGTEGRYSTPEMTAQQRRQQTLGALVSQLEGIAARRPVLLVFEVLHWVDPSTLELLDILSS